MRGGAVMAAAGMESGLWLPRGRRQALALALVLALVLIVWLGTRQVSQINILPDVPALTTPANVTCIILYWNAFYKRADYWAGYGRKPFVGCPQDNCVTTSNRSLLTEADAVIFHMRNKVLPLPPRRPHQRFVFFLMESPRTNATVSAIRDPRFRGVFNLTMTYRRDSDVLKGYMSVSEGAEPTPLPDLRSRSKAVAWIVSHCKTDSGRELYAAQLQRFIDVDVYGRCGPLNCTTNVAHECYRMVANDYHFYLSFENSQCRDYVTEETSSAAAVRLGPRRTRGQPEAIRTGSTARLLHPRL